MINFYFIISGFAFVFKLAGPIGAIFLLCFNTFINDYSLVLMIEGGAKCNSMSYQDFVQAAFGRPGFYILSLLQFTQPFCAMVSYNVIAGDTITFVVRRLLHLDDGVQSMFLSRHFVAFMTSILVTLPLSLYR